MSDSTAAPADLAKRLSFGLLVLRVTLGLFFFFWAIEKFIIPKKAIELYKKFFLIDMSISATYFLGAVLTVVSVAVLIGAYRKWSYGFALVAHTITVVFSWHRIIDPYGLIPKAPKGAMFEGMFTGQPMHLFLASIPVWGAIFLLYYLRDYDSVSYDGRQAKASE